MCCRGLRGDLYLLIKLLLPHDDKRVYHMKSKQIAKVVSNCTSAPLDAVVTDLAQGDVSETARKVPNSRGVRRGGGERDGQGGD